MQHPNALAAGLYSAMLENNMYSNLQIQNGVAFSTYEVRVDRMTVLRGNTTEQAALLASAENGTRVVSVVAFRCLQSCCHREPLL